MPDRGILSVEKDGVTFEVGAEVVHKDAGGAVIVFDPMTVWQAEGLALLEAGEFPVPLEAVRAADGRGSLIDVKKGWAPEPPAEQLARWQPFEPEQDGFDRPTTAWRRVPTLSHEPQTNSFPASHSSESAVPEPPTPAGGGEEEKDIPVVDAEPVSSLEPPAAVPSGVEKRREPRVEKSIPVSFDNLTDLIKEFTHNISFGGMFIYTTAEYDQGQDVSVTLIHPVSSERLTLLGRVIHRSSAPSPDPATGAKRYGIGIEFRMPPEELKRVLSDFITSPRKQQVPDATIVQQARMLLDRATDSPHQLLGVDEQATEAEVRRAYFGLVDRFHPDRFFGKISPADQAVLEELFRRLTGAYEKLTE